MRLALAPVLAALLCASCAHGWYVRGECIYQATPLPHGRFHLSVQWSGHSYIEPRACFAEIAQGECVKRGFNSYAVENADRDTHHTVIESLGDISCINVAD